MLKKLLRKIKSDIYANTMLNLLQLLVIPIICLLILFVSSYQMLMKREQSAMHKVVVDCAEKLENEIETTTAISSYLANNPQILKYLFYYNQEEDNSSLIKILDAQEILESLTLAMDKIALIQVYANGSDTLIDQKTCAAHMERYYNIFQIAGMDYEKWHDFFKQRTKTYEILYDIDFSYLGKAYESWMISYRIPQKSSFGNHGQLCIYIDKARILEEFAALEYRHGQGYLTVIDEDGTFLLLDNVSEVTAEQIREDISRLDSLDTIQIVKQERQKMLVLKHFSTELQAYVAMAVPVDYAYASINGIHILLLIMCIIMILASTMLAIRVTGKLTQPFLEIHHLLHKENDSSEELITELTALMEHNKNLKNEVMSSMPSLKTAALYNLLLAGFESREDMDRGISLIGIDRNARQYGLLIIGLMDLKDKMDAEEISMLQAFVGKAIEHDIEETQGIYFPDYERIIVLCAIYEDNKKDAERYLEEKLEKRIYPFFVQNQLRVILAGDVAEMITDFPGMFLRAQSVLKSHMEENQDLGVFWYSCEKKKYLKCNYPPEMENRLGSIMVMGNVKGLTEAFEDIKQANARIFEQNQNEEIIKLLNSLYQTLCRKQKEYRIHEVERLEQKKVNILQNMESEENLMQTFYLLEEAFYLCMDQNGDAWKEQKKNLSDRIHMYICQNYRNPQLCLSSIAEAFSITESYLSRLYKQAFGQTCNRAIELLRMEDAKMQLAQGKSVAQVAENVGYHSVQVFRRVYKKHFQEIPSKWKESMEAEQ